MDSLIHDALTFPFIVSIYLFFILPIRGGKFTVRQRQMADRNDMEKDKRFLTLLDPFVFAAVNSAVGN